MYSIEEISNKPHLWKNINDSLICLLVICLIIWLTKILWRRRKLYIYSYNIPGPFSLPLIGCTYQFLGDTSDIMGTLVKIQDSYPDFAKIWFGPKLIYLVSKPEHMEKILTSPECINKDYLYRFLSYVIGTGLMTAPDKKWRKHRKVLAPSFNQKILDTFMEVFADQSIVLEEQLQKYVEKRNIDLFTILSTCTLDIICETAMGVQMNAQKTESAFAKHLDKIMEITTLRIFHPWLQVDALFEYFPLGREYRKSINYYRDFCVSVIRKKTAEHQQRLEDERNGLRVDTEERGPKKIKAFLDLILENSNFTEEELREEVDIFIIAGTDTTASALTFFFTCMGIFQDIQEKVYEEIIGIIGYDRKVEPADLPHMKYTERVIKETLRVFPVAAFFLRQIGEDLDLGDAILPKGSTAFFGPVHIHRNPNYWEEPLKFDPDRFLPENIAKRHPCTYVPFSLGTRNCIGARYAMMSMKTMLATVIRRYKFTSEYKTIEEIKLKTNVVLRLKDGPKITIHNR